MENILSHYYALLAGMSLAAVFIFIVLYFVDAGYGILLNKKWGPTINNKLAWFLMESPVFFAMMLLWLRSDRKAEIVPIIFLVFFEIHYFRRSFIFPLQLKGNGKMPILIVVMGVTFNIINAIIQAGWIFYISPDEMYTTAWLDTPQFIIGTIIFFSGMYITIDSDTIIRNLRKPGDSKHYLPQKGMFKYVTSAQYLGELTEWIGFAILTWSWAGAVFALWTFANLVPRANTIYHKYQSMFGVELIKNKKLKRIFPYIY